jgi:hypothetical protein
VKEKTQKSVKNPTNDGFVCRKRINMSNELSKLKLIHKSLLIKAWLDV